MPRRTTLIPRELTEIKPDDFPNRRSERRRGWLGQWGNSIAYNQTVGPLGPFRLVDVKNVDDNHSQIVSGAISIASDIPFADTFFIRAQIDFGQGSVTHSVVVDVRRGVTFNLPCSSLRIAILPTVLAVVGSRGMLVSASAQLKGPQNRGSASATLTVNPGALAGNANVDVDVPAFAHSVELVRAPQTAPVTLKLLTAALVDVGEVQVAAGAQVPPVTLPGDVYRVNILNGATAITGQRLMFQLEL